MILDGRSVVGKVNSLDIEPVNIEEYVGGAPLEEGASCCIQIVSALIVNITRVVLCRMYCRENNECICYRLNIYVY